MGRHAVGNLCGLAGERPCGWLAWKEATRGREKWGELSYWCHSVVTREDTFGSRLSPDEASCDTGP